MSTQKLPDESESSLLQVALSCCEAVKVLSVVPANHTLLALAIIASQGIEATLKCHLLQCGLTLREVRGLGHDLLAAWADAAQAGPPIEEDTPSWLLAFNWGHAKPYPFRYLPHGYGAGVPKAEDFVPWWEVVLRTLRHRSAALI